MPENEGQAPSGQSQEQTAGNPSGGQGSSETFDAAYVRQLREEAAAHRKTARETAARLAELEAKQKADADAKLSEQERTSKRLAELELKESEWARERQELTVRHAAIAAASKANFHNPDAAYRLLDTSQIDYDPKGNPTNLAQLFADLAKQEPYLVRGPEPSNPTNPQRGGIQPPGTGSKPGETRDQFRRRMGLA